MSIEEKTNLTPYDDFFFTEEQSQDVKKEKVETINIADIVDFPNHPFKVLKDEELIQIVQSIREYGIINPCIGRKIDGKIQIVSGHRRKAACEILGIKTMPVLIRSMTDEEAVITMVDANLQRESIMPSEKAFAYKMKMNALKSQGKRTDLTFGQVGEKLNNINFMSKDSNDSGRQISRFIRLTYLIPQLLKKVDSKEIAFSPAVELSYLSEHEQEQLLNAMELYDCTPSLAQAIRLKEKSREYGVKASNWIEKIMAEEKPNQVEQIKLKKDDVRKYFPRNYTNDQIKNDIIKGLELLKKQRNRERDAR